MSVEQIRKNREMHMKTPWKRKKGYRFADDLVAADTVISFIFGIGSLMLSLFSVIFGIVRKGMVEDWIGTLLLVSSVMAATGLFFGLFSFRTVEGGMNPKRNSVMVSVVAIAILIILYFV